MRKIIVLSMMSLDGVIQAPGGPKEDTSNGFEYGGWTANYGDEVFAKVMEEELRPADYLLGRKTFEIWENYWPQQHGDFWPAINSGTKYVLSRTRTESSWAHSTFLSDLDQIKALKDDDGRDIHVWGSSELIHLLLAHDLVDELRLKIYPLILGKGKKLFDEGLKAGAFELADSVVTGTGVVIGRYVRSGDVVTGDVSV